ncbi:uncharacterized protein [Chanodichthys erythropterus]|uniref:uncharacterized protein isoform X1 n=1 Tax=Chanodichthys erythropterus TaxID=933992 RepID=UPI00351EAE3C
MEKFIFFCVICFGNMQITSSDASVRGSSDVFRAQIGEDITLNCSMRHRYEVAWYHLRSEELVLLISAEKDVTRKKLLTTYLNSTRLNITADSLITTVSFTISGVSESDSGLYFCGTKSDTPQMHFDKPIRLENQFTELPKNIDVTENIFWRSSSGCLNLSNSSVSVDDGVTVTERVLMFGGVGLAAFMFFLATVVAAEIIYHQGQQKGWTEAKRASWMSRKSAK